MLAFYSPLKNLSFAFATKKLLKQEHFDIISGFSQVYPQDVYRMGDGLHRHFLKVHSPKALLRFLDHLNPRHRSILFIEKQIFKPKNHYCIIANSTLCKNQAIDYYSVPEKKIEVIYNGVDSKRFCPAAREAYRSDLRTQLSIGADQIVILYVSRNYKRKGLRLLIQSLSLIKNRLDGLKAVVVGRENPLPYQRLALQYGVEDNLLFVKEERILEKYYGASDFLVLPTLYDPFSNVCLEALACGLPVITTRSNGVAEIITDGKNGYIIEDPRNPAELAQKIALLLTKEVREEMGQHAARSAQHFTTEENARKTLALYEKVFEGKKILAHSHHDGIIIHDAYRPLLTQNGLADFNALMYYRHGTVIKESHAERSTIKLMLKDKNGLVGAYLKRYQSSSFKTVIRSLVSCSLPRTAVDEWNAILAFHRLGIPTMIPLILAFHRLGIPTMIPLAVGVRKRSIVKKESFLLTREIEGTERLDHYLLRHFSPPLTDDLRREKRKLLKALALLVQQMHHSGCNHRDLYLCHVLIKKDASLTWHIYLADLHRVDQRRRVRLRWKVKDLAALNYSADTHSVTRTDRLRFIKYYYGEQKLTAHLKTVTKKVIRKTDKIRSHDLKIQKKASYN
jgi:UDP-glucose:(heptosyl)LPS alpha-1,3-glucosyltransferase